MLADFIKSRINQGINSCKTPMRCSTVEVNKDHIVVTINGGNNGYSDFNQYLTDIKTIINKAIELGTYKHVECAITENPFYTIVFNFHRIKIIHCLASKLLHRNL